MIYALFGGAGLNLKVVGGTSAPSSPKENTIWVNTSTAINGYAFSATEPENPVDSMVWISVGADSTAPMNIDKKNTVMLYPVGCKQYVGGAWTSKVAQTYLNGSWTSWLFVLWNYGDNTTASGGWGGNNFHTGSTLYDSGSATVNSDGTVTLATGNRTTACGESYTNLNPIDMTPFSTMAVHVTGAQDGWYGPAACFGVTPVRTGNTQWTARKAGVTMGPSAAKNQGIVTVDITAVNEPCYVLVGVAQSGGAGKSESKITFSKIELY